MNRRIVTSSIPSLLTTVLRVNPPLLFALPPHVPCSLPCLSSHSSFLLQQILHPVWPSKQILAHDHNVLVSASAFIAGGLFALDCGKTFVGTLCRCRFHPSQFDGWLIHSRLATDLRFRLDLLIRFDVDATNRRSAFFSCLFCCVHNQFGRKLGCNVTCSAVGGVLSAANGECWVGRCTKRRVT